MTANAYYVNSSWTDPTAFTSWYTAEMQASYPGLVYNTNAFGTARGALDTAVSNPGTEAAPTTIDFMTTPYAAATAITDGEGVCFETSGYYTLTGGAGTLFNYEVQLNQGKSNSVYVTMDITDANLTAGKINLYTNSTMTIKDSTLDFMAFQGGSSWFGVKKNSVLTIDNSTVGNKTSDWGSSVATFFGPTMRIYGTATVKNNSTLYTSVGSSYFASEALNICGNGTLTVKDSTVYMTCVNLGNEFGSGYFYGDSSAATSASIVLDNGKMYNTQYQGDPIGTRSEGVIVGDGSSHAGALTLKNGSIVDLSGNNSNNLHELLVNSNGAITMDATSAFTVGSITNNGTLTIDMSNGTKAFYKLIDADASSSSNYGTYQFATGKDNGYSLSIQNNDLYAYNSSLFDKTTLIVDASLTDKGFCEEVTVGEKTYYYGVSAFSTLGDALTNYDSTSTTEVDIIGEVTASSDTIASGETVVVSGSDNVLKGTLTNSGTIIVENATLGATMGTIANSGTVTVTGTSKLSSNSYAGDLYVGSTEAATTLTTDGLSFDNSTTARTIYITDGSTVTFSGSGFDFDEQSDYGVNIRNSATERSAEDHVGHTLNFNNVTLTADQAFHSIYTNSGSVVNFSNSTTATTSNGNYINTYGGTVNVKDASNISVGFTNTTGEVNVTGANTQYSTFDVTLFGATTGYHAGVLNVTDGAALSVVYEIDINNKTKDAVNYATGGSSTASMNVSNATVTAGSINNSGTITMGTAGKVTTTGALANSGTITMDATSAFTVGTLTNTGTITVDMSAGTQGFYKLIDASSASTYGTYQFATGKDNGYSLLIQNNDLFAFNVSLFDKTTLIVDASLTDKGFCDEVTVGGKTYYYGVNAFSTLGAALANYDSASTKEVDVIGEVTASSDTIASGETVVANGSGNVLAGSLTNNGTITVTGTTLGGTITNNGTINAKNARIDATEWTSSATSVLNVLKGTASMVGGGFGDVNVANGVTISTPDTLTSGTFLLADGATVTFSGCNIAATAVKGASSSPTAGYTLNIGDGASTVDTQVGSLDVSAKDTVNFKNVSNELTTDGEYNIAGTANLTNGSIVKQTTVNVSGDLVVDGTSTITATTLNVLAGGEVKAAAGGTLTASTLAVANGGAVSLAAGNSLTASTALTNAGTISVASVTALPSLSFSGNFSNTGTISIDMSEATDMSYKLIDNTGSKTMSLSSYGTIDLNNGDYSLFAIDNDLYAYDTSVVKVNTAWTSESTLPTGYTWGINAFNSLATATATVGTGSRTYEFVNADTAAMMSLTVSVTSGFADVSIVQDGTTVMSFSVAGSVTKSFGITADKTTSIVVKGDSASYLMSSTQTPVKPAPTGESLTPSTVGSTVTQTGHVGYGTGVASYELVVAQDQSGVYTFGITPKADSYSGSDFISYRIEDANGKAVTYASTATAQVRTLQLTEGTYTVTIDSLDHGEGKHNSGYDVSVTANKINSGVSLLDNAQTGTGVATMTLSGICGSKVASQTDFVGLGDATDWIKLAGVESGLYTLSFATAEAATAQGSYVYLYKVENAADASSQRELVASATYRGAAVTMNNVVLNSSYSYFLQVSSPDAYSSNNDATYTVTLTESQKIDGLKDTDDAWNGTGVTELEEDTMFSDYVGVADECDWYKLDEDVDGKCKLDVTATGGLLNVQVYAQKSSTALEPVAYESLMRCYNGKSNSMTFSCADGYDYYVKFTTQDGYKTSYTAKIASVI